MKRFARKLLICLLSAWCALSTMQIPVHAQEEIVKCRERNSELLTQIQTYLLGTLHHI